MTVTRNVALPILACLFAVACTGDGAKPDAKAPAAPQASGQGEAGGELDMWARIGELPPQQVARDSCGLFLWANLPKRTLVFFSSNHVSGAKVMFAGKERTLPLVSAEGDNMLGHFTTQRYEDQDVKVTVAFEAEAKEGLRGGAIVRSGTWRIEEKGGWELILPVAGLIGCN